MSRRIPWQVSEFVHTAANLFQKRLSKEEFTEYAESIKLCIDVIATLQRELIPHKGLKRVKALVGSLEEIKQKLDYFTSEDWEEVKNYFNRSRFLLYASLGKELKLNLKIKVHFWDILYAT